MRREQESTYEEDRKHAQKSNASSNKPRLSRVMIAGIVLLECTAIGGMGYLIYRLYF